MSRAGVAGDECVDRGLLEELFDAGDALPQVLGAPFPVRRQSLRGLAKKIAQRKRLAGLADTAGGYLMKVVACVTATAAVVALTLPAMAKNTDDPYVGVVPARNPFDTQCSEGMVTIRMDDEDNRNANMFKINQELFISNVSAGGMAQISSPRAAGGNSSIRYCPTYTPSLPSLSYDYAVISASNVCPANSHRFWRRMDKEDTSNHNRSEGDISPNVNSNNGGVTIINFCFVPAQSGAPSWHAAFHDSLIFAVNDSMPFVAYFYMDDEDDSNNNSYGSSNADYTARMQKIIRVGGNSQFNFVSGSDVYVLDKGNEPGCGSLAPNLGVQCSYYANGIKQCGPAEGTIGSAFALLSTMICAW